MSCWLPCNPPHFCAVFAKSYLQSQKSLRERRKDMRVWHPATNFNQCSVRRVSFKFLICEISKRIRGSLPCLQEIVRSKPKLRKLLIDDVHNVPASVITAIFATVR